MECLSILSYEPPARLSYAGSQASTVCMGELQLQMQPCTSHWGLLLQLEHLQEPRKLPSTKKPCGRA